MSLLLRLLPHQRERHVVQFARPTRKRRLQAKRCLRSRRMRVTINWYALHVLWRLFATWLPKELYCLLYNYSHPKPLLLQRRPGLPLARHPQRLGNHRLKLLQNRLAHYPQRQ